MSERADAVIRFLVGIGLLPQTLTVLQLHDAMVDRVDALVDLLVLILRLLPHALALLLQQFYLPLQFPFEVLHPPDALSPAGGTFGRGRPGAVGVRGSRTTASRASSRCWGRRTAGRRRRSPTSVPGLGVAVATAAAATDDR